MKEEAVLFGKTGSLVGIITDPPNSEKRHNLPAFIFLNSGILHRVGPNRLSVRMARDLATLGFVGCRIDFSGIGDSPSNSDNLSIEKRWVKETQEAMDLLDAKRGIKRFVLIGNCSGAAFSFLTARSDPRVIGTVLMNIQGHRTLMRYYVKLAFSNPKMWLRIIKGSARYSFVYKAVRLYVQSLFTRNNNDSYGANELVRDLRLLIERGTDLLFVYSEWDPGLPYFYAYLEKEIVGLSSTGKVDLEIIQGMNHDFNLLRGQQQLIEIVHNWALRMLQD